MKLIGSVLLLGLAGTPALALPLESSPPPPTVLAPLLPREAPLAPQTLTPITQGQAKRYSPTVTLFAGRNSAIEFQTGEKIQFLQLSDPALMTFLTNAPVASGEANVIVLRLIRPIRFPGLISTQNPNLTVTTNRGTYFFDLKPTYRSQNESEPSGIAIVPGEIISSSTAAQTAIETRQGQATIEDIRRGLTVAIRKGYSKEDDPVVAQVERAMRLMRQGSSIPAITDAIKSPQLPAVLMRLGELGILDRLNGANRRPSIPPPVTIPVPQPSTPTPIPPAVTPTT